MLGCKVLHYIVCTILFLVYHMKETGWVKVSQNDVKELHYKYQDEKKK